MNIGTFNERKNLIIKQLEFTLKRLLNCKNDYQLRHILTSFLKYNIEDINSIINEIDFIITLEQLHLINE